MLNSTVLLVPIFAAFAVTQVKVTDRGILPRLKLTAGAVHLYRDTMTIQQNGEPKKPTATVSLRRFQILSVKGDTAKTRYETFVQYSSGKYRKWGDQVVQLKWNGEPFADGPIVSYTDDPMNKDTVRGVGLSFGPGLKVHMNYTTNGLVEKFKGQDAISMNISIKGIDGSKGSGTQTNRISVADGWVIEQETDVTFEITNTLKQRTRSKIERVDPRLVKIELEKD